MNDSNTENIIDVSTGEVKVSSVPAVLRALAIGSCVAVVAYDKINKIGGLAHVMLPGRSLRKEEAEKLKYAEDAMDFLLTNMQRLGSDRTHIEINLIGAANMLDEGSIPEQVLESVLVYLETLGIEPKNQKIGGNTFRGVYFDIGSGEISYSEGSNRPQIL